MGHAAVRVEARRGRLARRRGRRLAVGRAVGRLCRLRQGNWPGSGHGRPVRHGATGCLKRVRRHRCRGGQHGFPAPALSTEASTDGYENGKAHQGAKERNLPPQVVFIYVSLNRRPNAQEIDPGGQPCPEAHDDARSVRLPAEDHSLLLKPLMPPPDSTASSKAA